MEKGCTHEGVAKWKRIVVNVVNNQFHTPKEKALPTSFAKWRRALPTSFAKWRRVAHTRALPSENEGRGCCKQPVHTPKEFDYFLFISK
ncbi:10096_t:CDS:2 [Rhizophagus irregularis]|nr:10096_t:CDS:2 [Rhizophagus irregularis]